MTYSLRLLSSRKLFRGTLSSDEQPDSVPFRIQSLPGKTVSPATEGPEPVAGRGYWSVRTLRRPPRTHPAVSDDNPEPGQSCLKSFANQLPPQGFLSRRVRSLDVGSVPHHVVKCRTDTNAMSSRRSTWLSGGRTRACQLAVYDDRNLSKLAQAAKLPEPNTSRNRLPLETASKKKIPRLFGTTARDFVSAMSCVGASRTGISGRRSALFPLLLFLLLVLTHKTRNREKYV